MVDAGKELADIRLQGANLAVCGQAIPQQVLGAIRAGMSPLAGATGIAVTDEPALPDRLDNSNNGVLNHPVCKIIECSDFPVLWFKHAKAAIPCRMVLTPDQPVLQIDQVLLQPGFKSHACQGVSFAFSGLQPGCMQGVKTDHFFP